MDFLKNVNSIEEQIDKFYKAHFVSAFTLDEYPSTDEILELMKISSEILYLADELNSSIEALYDYDQLGKYENDECWNGDYYE